MRQRQRERTEEREKKKAVQCYVQRYLGMVCSQTKPPSSCTKLLLNDLHGFLGKTSKSKSLTRYVLQHILHTSVLTMLKDCCNVICAQHFQNMKNTNKRGIGGFGR